MIQIEQSIVVKHPIEEVFAFAAHPKNNPKWWRGVVEDQLLTTEPIQQGTRFREVAKEPWGTIEHVAEVTVYEPPRQMAYKAVSGPLPTAVTQTLDPVASGTRVTLTVHVQPRGLLKLLQPLLRRTLRQTLQGNLVRLQSLLEAQP